MGVEDTVLISFVGTSFDVLSEASEVSSWAGVDSSIGMGILSPSRRGGPAAVSAAIVEVG